MLVVHLVLSAAAVVRVIPGPAAARTASSGLSFPLPPVVVATSPEPAGSGHAWFPQFFQSFGGSAGASLVGAVQADDDGCSNRSGCSATCAGHCDQPCVPVGQSFVARMPAPGDQPSWRQLAPHWGGMPSVVVPRSACARPSLSAVGEIICPSWRWSPQPKCRSSSTTNCSSLG